MPDTATPAANAPFDALIGQFARGDFASAPAAPAPLTAEVMAGMLTSAENDAEAARTFTATRALDAIRSAMAALYVARAELTDHYKPGTVSAEDIFCLLHDLAGDVAGVAGKREDAA